MAQSLEMFVSANLSEQATVGILSHQGACPVHHSWCKTGLCVSASRLHVALPDFGRACTRGMMVGHEPTNPHPHAGLNQRVEVLDEIFLRSHSSHANTPIQHFIHIYNHQIHPLLAMHHKLQNKGCKTCVQDFTGAQNMIHSLPFVPYPLLWPPKLFWGRLERSAGTPQLFGHTSRLHAAVCIMFPPGWVLRYQGCVCLLGDSAQFMWPYFPPRSDVGISQRRFS